MLFTRLLAATERLPSLCAVCRGWGAQRVCEACVERFAIQHLRCQRCALRVPDGVRLCGACLNDPPPFAHALAALDYDHPWDGLITQFKFHGALDLAPALTRRLLATFEASHAPVPTLLLPVPLSTERLRERGYNQAWELARRVGRVLHCQADAHLLLRTKDTPHQLAFPPAQRAGNVRAAFAIEPRRLADVRGRSVTVVDDVMTTGATVSEITRVLLQAGASEVGVWTLARTPRHGET
ncbi:MAG: ComF family protein [Burkholderiales bacterium]